MKELGCQLQITEKQLTVPTAFKNAAFDILMGLDNKNIVFKISDIVNRKTLIRRKIAWLIPKEA
jgi:hypothetical protein